MSFRKGGIEIISAPKAKFLTKQGVDDQMKREQFERIMQLISKACFYGRDYAEYYLSIGEELDNEVVQEVLQLGYKMRVHTKHFWDWGSSPHSKEVPDVYTIYWGDSEEFEANV